MQFLKLHIQIAIYSDFNPHNDNQNTDNKNEWITVNRIWFLPVFAIFFGTIRYLLHFSVVNHLLSDTVIDAY